MKYSGREIFLSSTQRQFYLETWDFLTFSSLTKWFLLNVKLLFVHVLASCKIKQNAFLFKQKYMKSRIWRKSFLVMQNSFIWNRTCYTQLLMLWFSFNPTNCEVCFYPYFLPWEVKGGECPIPSEYDHDLTNHHHFQLNNLGTNLFRRTLLKENFDHCVFIFFCSIM